MGDLKPQERHYFDKLSIRPERAKSRDSARDGSRDGEQVEPRVEGLIERIYWLIRLRWLAIIGVVSTVIFAKKIINISLPFFPLYIIATILGTYNLAFLVYLNQIKKKKTVDLALTANRLANIQISFDLLSLTGLLHFSGGIENPFFLYFIFHMIIASILLSRRASFLQATFASGLFTLMAGLEHFGFLPHYSLKGFVPYALYDDRLYILGVEFAFISAIYIAVYMATSISEKLRERERNLAAVNLLLEEKDRIKSEYVLRVSHDIKEHLSAIQSCIQPVVGGITGELNLKQKDLILRASQRTAKLLFFVKALLEITRIKLKRQIEMDYFSLKDTAQSAISFIETSARDKNINIAYNIAPGIDRIKGAQVYIEETIANLLANSVKYTPEGGRISLEIKEKDDSVLIQISDTGIGIPEDEIDRIFDEFYRAKNAKEAEKEGTGLGLSIAKEVVERHKGKIWAESQEGKGSTFYILLPK